MPLPVGVDTNDVEANYNDEILEVCVHIDQDTETRTKIPVGRNS